MCFPINKNECWICQQLESMKNQYPLSNAKHLQGLADTANSNVNRKKIQIITKQIISNLNKQNCIDTKCKSLNN